MLLSSYLLCQPFLFFFFFFLNTVVKKYLKECSYIVGKSSPPKKKLSLFLFLTGFLGRLLFLCLLLLGMVVIATIFRIAITKKMLKK